MAAASLALVPISPQVFRGPMACAMMGGIIAGAAITLFFAPALYLAVFRVRREMRVPTAREQPASRAPQPDRSVDPRSGRLPCHKFGVPMRLEP